MPPHGGRAFLCRLKATVPSTQTSMAVAAIAAQAEEVERLRLALFDVLNCEECGGKGYDYVPVGTDDVEGVGCHCRDRAERVLADWRPDPAVYLDYTDAV